MTDAEAALDRVRNQLWREYRVWRDEAILRRAEAPPDPAAISYAQGVLNALDTIRAALEEDG